MDLFDFSTALLKLKSGRFVSRKGWNGKGMYLFIKWPLPTDVGGATLPYIMMITAQRDLVPWLASQTDVLASDWVIVGRDEDMRIDCADKP